VSRDKPINTMTSPVPALQFQATNRTVSFVSLVNREKTSRLTASI